MVIPKLVSTIFNKWTTSNEKKGEICFVRHINRDKGDNRPANLMWCAPSEAFLHPEWTVDWTAPLTDEEVHFVRTNMGNFQKLSAMKYT